MKYLFLLFSSFLFAQNLDTLGTTVTTGTVGTVSPDMIVMNLYTCTTTSRLDSGFVYGGNGGIASNAKLLVYLDDGDSVPDAGDALVGYTGAVVNSAIQWHVGLFSDGQAGAILAGSKYWLILACDPASGAGWPYRFQTGQPSPPAPMYIKSSAGVYSSPPSNLPTGYTSSSGRTFSLYLTSIDIPTTSDSKVSYRKYQGYFSCFSH